MAIGSRLIAGDAFRPLNTVSPGDNLFFTAGAVIAVETWAVEMGHHEFDYEVNSRTTGAGGRPDAIASTRGGLRNEFVERRIVSRLPIPISIGDFSTSRLPKVALTYGEVSPQIYRSKSISPTIAWSLKLKAHRFVAAQGKTSIARNSVMRNRNAIAAASHTVRMQTFPIGEPHLLIYVREADFVRTRILKSGFGVTDLIGTEPSFIEHWVTRILPK